MIRDHKIHIATEILDDLNFKIKHTRWPDEITGSGWAYGASLSYMKELADYWLHHFDWRKTEAEINQYKNYIAEIDGHEIHFLHIKGKGKISIPLIITHGWPGSFLEMMKLIPVLTTNPEFSFDLVIPSLMGFGFSQKITAPGCNGAFMADLWFKLMQELGYKKFAVQGGDFGAGVSALICHKYPEHIIGMHLNYIPGMYVPVLAGGEQFSAEEIEYLKDEADWQAREYGYGHQQKTKPLTLAYGLSDSPVGLCAWIIEKMYGWADCKQNIESVFTKDELLSNVTLYWVTATIHSSIRLYNENSKIALKLGNDDRINVPVGIARFRYEDPFPPRKFIERGFNIQQWSQFDKGGHFAAMEQPVLLGNDIIKFFRKIYESNG